MRNQVIMDLYALHDRYSGVHTVFNANDKRYAVSVFNSFCKQNEAVAHDMELVKIGSYDMFKGEIYPCYVVQSLDEEEEEKCEAAMA